MNAYQAEFLDEKMVRCSCTIAESSLEKAEEKLRRLWTVKEILSLHRCRYARVTFASPDGPDLFEFVFPG